MSRDTAMAALTGQPVSVTTPLGATEPARAQDASGGVAQTPMTPPPTTSTPLDPPAELPSKAFSQFAKKEAEIVRQRQELALEREKIEKATQQYQAYQEAKAKDPIAALKMLGFSETDVFNYMAAQQAPPELTSEQKAVQAAEAATDAKIKAFEDAQQKKAADEQKKADEAVIQTYRKSVASVIQAAPEKYEYCAYHGESAQDLIYETVLAVVKDSEGKDVPTPDEAAQMVEEYYEEQDREMSKLKKRQPKEVPAPPVEAPKEPTRTRTLETPPSKPTRTLSSSATVTAASARAPVNESRSDKRERLMERLKNGV